MSLYLIVFAREVVAHTYLIEADRVEIGRGEDAMIRLDDRMVSRSHARLIISERARREYPHDAPIAQVTDIGSSYGIWVEGEQVFYGDLSVGQLFQVSETTSLCLSYHPERILTELERPVEEAALQEPHEIEEVIAEEAQDVEEAQESSYAEEEMEQIAETEETEERSDEGEVAVETTEAQEDPDAEEEIEQIAETEETEERSDEGEVAVETTEAQEDPDAEEEIEQVVETEETEERSDEGEVAADTAEAQMSSDAIEEVTEIEEGEEGEEMNAELTASAESHEREEVVSMSVAGAVWAPLQRSYSELSAALGDQLKRAHASLPVGTDARMLLGETIAQLDELQLLLDPTPISLEEALTTARREVAALTPAEFSLYINNQAPSLLVTRAFVEAFKIAFFAVVSADEFDWLHLDITEVDGHIEVRSDPPIHNYLNADHLNDRFALEQLGLAEHL